MAPYTAPLDDMRFVLHRLVGLEELNALPGYEAATPDVVDQVLEEAGRLAAEVLAPLNPVGDREHAVLENGAVRSPEGFKEAYDRYRDGGWNAVPFDAQYGGTQMPWAVAFAVQEMWQSANIALGNCFLLNQGAVELLTAHGSEAQKRLYLPKMITGEWNGTMALTEPQAGSDLGAVRTRAVPDPALGDGVYRITGQKIFITYAEHDLTDNTINLVLARTPDAPAGSRGLSVFLVPKVLLRADGSLGERNDLRCVSLERKLGLHASPTCLMAFGDSGGAIGTLIGEANRGIESMFTMMNNARLSVGMQGVAIAERAYQQARDYARSRVQGHGHGRKRGGPVTIIHHPDVRRMLLTMKAQIEAARALAYLAGAALDTAKRHPDPAARAAAQARVDLLTPVVKAWCTDLGVEIASTGIQVHGGMGYIEEAGAAQHYRDGRAAPIYEGTNGIQANDLVFRKLGRDSGAAASDFIAELRSVADALAAAPGDDAEAIRHRLGEGIDALERTTGWLVGAVKQDPPAVAAGAAHYLRLFGIVAGGAMMARAALAALAAMREPGAGGAFLDAKLITARFYADQILPQATGLVLPVIEGYRTVMALAEEQF